MHWNNYDTELEQQLRRERNAAEDKLFATRGIITELRRQLSTQRKYIEALEKQLEANVVEEVRGELERPEEADDSHRRWASHPKPIIADALSNRESDDVAEEAPF